MCVPGFIIPFIAYCFIPPSACSTIVKSGLSLGFGLKHSAHSNAYGNGHVIGNVGNLECATA